MKSIRLTALVSGALVAAAAAQAADSDLKLSHGKIFTDPVGTVVEVTIRNETTSAFGSAVVTCVFSTAGKPAGSASTTLYNLLPGGSGTDQVHLMGGKADDVACQISSTTPGTN